MGAVLAPVLLLVLLALLLSQARRTPKVTLTVVADALQIRLGGVDALYCLKRTLVLPLASIQGVAVATKASVPRTGLRLPGTSLPGVIRAGSYGTGRSRDFWDVRRATVYFVVQLLPGGRYRRVVLELPDPQGEVARLAPVIGVYEGAFPT